MIRQSAGYQGGTPVSDDPSRAEQHLINRARKRQAPPPSPPSGQPVIKRVKRFSGTAANTYWLSQAWSPDGSQLAFGGRTGGNQGALHVWDGNSGHHEKFSMRHLTHGLAGPVIGLEWSPDSQHLAAVGEGSQGQRTVHVRRQDQAPRPIPVPPGVPVTQAAWSPDGTLLALSGPGCEQTALVDVATGAVRKVLDNLSGPVAWQPDGQLIAGLHETNVLLCDPVTGARVKRLAEQTHRPTALGWARHGKYLAVSDGERIVVWNADAEEWHWRLPWTTSEGDRGPDAAISSLQWLDGGGYLLEFRPRGGAWRDERGSTVATAILWDLETGKAPIVELFYEISGGVRQPPAGLALAPDGRRFALANDGIVPVIWQVAGDLPHLVL
jgi:WD40 repeat protein